MSIYNACTTSSAYTISDLQKAIRLMKSLKLPSAPPEIVTSPWLPKHGNKWQFPRDRFVEYEESDEQWARPLGFGCLVEDTDTLVAWQVDWSKVKFPLLTGRAAPQILVHPDVVAALERDLERRCYENGEWDVGQDGMPL